MLHGWNARTTRESVERILSTVDDGTDTALENLSSLINRLRCFATSSAADGNSESEAFSLLLSANAELARGNLEAVKAFLILALKELAEATSEQENTLMSLPNP